MLLNLDSLIYMQVDTCHRTYALYTHHMQIPCNISCTVLYCIRMSINRRVTLVYRLEFPLGRLKTGTPARILKDTIDFGTLSKQDSDLPPPPFSYLNINKGVKNKDNLISCYQTFTNENTHRVVMDNAHLLPQYDGGDGGGVGPRYCPSLYLKVIH